MRKLLFVALAAVGSLAVVGCGPAANTITVGGHALVIKEQNYNVENPGYFCNTLANGQYEVIISDFTLCGDLQLDLGNGPAFHSTNETNLRMIFPSFLKVQGTTFQVGPTDCVNPPSNPNTEAVFAFSHNPAGGSTYDYNVQAESGTISITSTTESIMTDEVVNGTFNVMIGGAAVTGSIHALLCNSLAPGLGT